MIVNVYGPPASGKTRNAERLRKLYQCSRIRDDGRLDAATSKRRRHEYLSQFPLEDGDLVLSHEPITQEADFCGIPIDFINIETALARLAGGAA